MHRTVYLFPRLLTRRVRTLHQEAARLSALNGAELILMSTANVVDDEVHGQLAVRSMENVAPIVMANYTTGAGKGSFPWNDDAGFPGNGSSAAFDHLGEQLLVAPDNRSSIGNGEGIHICSIDIDAARSERQTARGASLRDPPLYPDLCNFVKSTVYADARGDGLGLPRSGSIGRLAAAL